METDKDSERQAEYWRQQRENELREWRRQQENSRANEVRRNARNDNWSLYSGNTEPHGHNLYSY